MPTLTKVLEVNWVILYSIYGQVFFVMGLVTGLQWQRQSRLELARPLPWLAGFGIAHGLVEWGYIFVPLQSLYLPDRLVRLMLVAHLLLLAASFFFLLQFGTELLLPGRPGRRRLRAVPGALLLLWGGAVMVRGLVSDDPLNILMAIGDGWSRYLLCLPGSVLAFIGLRRQASQVRAMGLPRIAAYMTGAAVAFLVYALVAGLVVPTAPIFPASFLNYSLVLHAVRVPVPVFRSLCGLAMAVFVVRSLDVFRAETERRLAQMERVQALAADRERIGRELHDGIIQNIYAAGLGLERMERQLAGEPEQAGSVRAVLEILNRTIQDIRRYIFDLHAGEQPRPLEMILEDMVRELRLDTLLDVDLHVMGARCWPLSSHQVGHLTQIAREALSNAVQHAKAHRVTVDLRYAPDSVCLSVADDGQGTAPGVAGRGARPGHGLANMRERAHLLGGELSLETEPGYGLRLSVTVPGPEGRR